MKGDLVVVRGYMNEPAVVRVWRESDEVVEVLAEGDYAAALERGFEVVWPVGVRREDVFAFDEAAAGRLRGGSTAWNELRAY